MRTRPDREHGCTYVVVADSVTASSDGLRDFANYLSTLSLAGADVVVIDPSPRLQFELNARTLRWVGRHLPVRQEYLTPSGTIDLVRAGTMVASCEKVIIAGEDSRYTPEAVARLCELLESHEVVEPQDYLDPLPWWGGIEAGRILIHRGIEPQPDHGATFGFRRSAIRSLRQLGAADIHDDQARRLASVGAEVYPAADVFVRRQPAPLGVWWQERARQAEDDFVLPVKTAFFFALAPLLLLLTVLGSAKLAGSYAGVIAFGAVVLAIRGRLGASSFFPLRAVFFAPLWVLERSVCVYWALLRRVRGVEEPVRVAVPERGGGTRVASGE